MEWMGLNEIREQFLAFFESKGHMRLPSFSLMPQNDNSLLLINSGMAPMKKYFTGEITPPSKRVTTCQKCIRTPDIERVGKTARHGTYFEMLGNFSFGDYFKPDATTWAWEFCTDVMEMPLDKLWVSIYQDDDESFDIWTKHVGIPAEKIVRLGKEDNFWEHGTGPCGPCSEIYYDRGEEYGCGSPDCAVGCDCDRFTEFWNLVFTQFDSDGKGNYTPLEHPNIDTGMGLERLACISQGVGNLFEVDTVQNIMKHISKIANVEYKKDEKTDVSLRVITDHIRSTTFMIGDGVMPSNEGRGYVLRRLLRRAARHGKLLGIEGLFLADVAKTVIKENETAYPNLVEKQDLILKIIEKEEENFGKRVDAGLMLLSQFTEELKAKGGKVLSGDEAFKLYDTYGFPVDLTKDILEEQGLEVDEARFDELMLKQRQQARNARKDAGADAWKGDKNLLEDIQETIFRGYETTKSDGKVLAILANDSLEEAIGQGDAAVIVLDETAFYAESGGQAGDFGVIRSGDAVFQVNTTTKTDTGIFLHSGEVLNGTICTGDAVTSEVDGQARKATMANHTAAHLLQAALRNVLGGHVEQAGQYVNDKLVRFDFTHFSALTAEELAEVERQVNGAIADAIAVTSQEMPIAEAKKIGAMALFGEKYGDVVRVVNVEGFSIELCGGTHVDNTSKLGLFKITSEASVAAGVRRIEAVTSLNLLEYLNHNLGLLTTAAQAMKAGNTEDVPARASQLVDEAKSKEKLANDLRAELAKIKADSMLSGAKDIGGLRLIVSTVEGVTPDALRAMGDSAKSYGNDIIAVIAGIQKEKGTANIVAVCGKDAIARGAKAGDIVKAIAKLAGGGGGGRPDSAMAGAKDLSKLSDAMNQAEQIVTGLLH